MLSAQDLQLPDLNVCRMLSCSNKHGMHQQLRFAIQSGGVQLRDWQDQDSQASCNRAGKRLKTKSVSKIFIYLPALRAVDSEIAVVIAALAFV